MLLEYGKNILDMREVIGVSQHRVRSVTFTLKSGSQVTMNCNNENEAHKLYECASKTLKFMAQCKKLLTGSTEVTHETVPQDPQNVKQPTISIPYVPPVQPSLPGIWGPGVSNPNYPVIGDSVSDIKITYGNSTANN